MLRCMPFSLLTVLLFTVALTAGAVTPVVTTTAATQVTDSSAVFNGTIDPMGGVFEVWAEYGLTTNYGYITQVSSYFSGTGVKTCGFTPLGLATNTTFHFRITATDGTNTYVGNDMTCTTLADPPVLGTALAGVSSLTPTEVNFSLNSIQAGSSQVTVSYEYGLTASYGAVVTSPTQVDKDLISYTTCFAKATGLAPGTTYHFRAKAVNAQGTMYSADNTFTTPLGPVLVTGAATGVSDLAATMNGTVMTDGLLLNVSFDIGFTTDYGGSFSVANGVSNTSAMPVSLRPPFLPPATTFHYRLKASYYYDSSIVFYGTDQTFTTLTPRTPPTVAPVSVLGVGVTKVVVDCPQVVAGSSDTTVVYQYGPTTAYGSSATFQTVLPANGGSDVLMMLSGLTANTTYHLRCVATNAQGSTASDDVVFTTLLMPAIATVAATSVGDMSAVINGSLSISGVTFPVGVGFDFGTTTSYGTSVTPSPTSITGTFNAAVAGLLPGTTYHYRSWVTYDDTYYGPDMTFTTAAAQTPPSVGTVNNYQVSVTAVTLTAYPISAGSSTATVFWEYQAAGGPVQTASSTTQPNTLALGTTGNYNEITLTNLQPGTTYTYRCGATNGQGTGYSASDTFTTLPAPIVTTSAATSVGDITAVLNGSAWAKDNSYYHLYFDVGTTTSYGTLVYPSPGDVSGNTDPAPVTATAYQLLPNTTYHYRLRASCYLSGSRTLDPPSDFYGADQTFTTGPPATAPTATTEPATGLATTAATLSSAVNAGSSPTTLVFEYGTTTAYGSQYAYPGTLGTSTQTAPFYLLQGLTPNTTYHYRVTATNHEGASTGPDVSFTTLQPPTITTMPATYILANSATLAGSSDGKGGSYTVAFDYGVTTAYGQTATATPTVGSVTVGIGTGGVIINAPSSAPNSAGSDLSGNAVSQGVIIIGGGGGGGGGLGGGGGTILPGTGYYKGYDASLLPQTAYHFRLKLTDAQGNSYYGADATFTTLSPVQAWRMGVFYTPDNTGVAADTASPAGDGIPNLLKYALNMAPATPGTLPQPQLKDYSGASHLSLTFQRDPSKTDLTYEVQAADSPAGPWTTLASSVGGAATIGPGFVGETYHGGGIGTILVPGGPPMDVEVMDTVSMQEAPSRFMRLRVTR